MNMIIAPSIVSGTIHVPSSKSHTMRAILLASLARGESHVNSALPSPDTQAMIAACRAIGASISVVETARGLDLAITGTGGQPCAAETVIDAGNSGQVLRFVAAMAALGPHYAIFTGDASIRSLRPMQPLLDGLAQTGAFAVSSRGNGYAPVIVRGPARAGAVHIADGQDSQTVSALLMLAAFLDGTTSISVDRAGETPWIGLTLHWLEKLGVPFTNKGFVQYTVTGPVVPEGFDYTVPADWSSAAFPIGAALVSNATITIENMDFDDVQGDKAILGCLESMGARFLQDRANKKLTVLPTKSLPANGLRGATIDVNHIIDAVPVLAAIACHAKSSTTIKGAAIARHKESDRIAAIASELGKLGARIEERPDGMVVHPSCLHGTGLQGTDLHGGSTESHHDHRIAMAVAVAALGASGPVTIRDTACVAKSFPGFTATMRGAGAKMEEA